MNPEENELRFNLDFEDVAQFIFERLVDLGYVPETDELLDMADIFMDMFLRLHIAMGGKYMMVEEEYDEEEE